MNTVYHQDFVEFCRRKRDSKGVGWGWATSLMGVLLVPPHGPNNLSALHITSDFKFPVSWLAITEEAKVHNGCMPKHQTVPYVF